MFVTNWISPTKIQKISEITNFFRHYFLSRTEVSLTRTTPSTKLDSADCVVEDVDCALIRTLLPKHSTAHTSNSNLLVMFVLLLK